MFVTALLHGWRASLYLRPSNRNTPAPGASSYLRPGFFTYLAIAPPGETLGALNIFGPLRATEGGLYAQMLVRQRP